MSKVVSIIETGVDKLVKIIKMRGEISLPEASKILGVSATVVQEWAEFLEEEGIVNIEYRLTTPYLIDRKITKEDIETKKKEFDVNKNIFVRKTEIALMSLEERGEDLKNIKKEFDDLKNDLGMGFDKVKGELKDLDKYDKLKKDIEARIAERKAVLAEKFSEMHKEIEREQRKYQFILTEIGKEDHFIEEEKKKIFSLEEMEQHLLKKLNGFKENIKEIEGKLHKEDQTLRFNEKHIEELKEVSRRIKQKIVNEKESFKPLIEKNIQSKNDIEKMQETIIRKLEDEKKKISDIEHITEKFKRFFSKKVEVEELVNQIMLERDELQHEFKTLIHKAKAFQISASDKNVMKDMADLDERFKKVDEKKSIFEKEISKLVSLLKKEH